MLEIKINENLKELPLIDYRQLEEFQGELKELAHDDYVRLRNTLKDQGLLMPFALWLNPDNQKINLLDGHQRRRLFMMESVTPYLIPYLLIPGKNIEEAKKNLLVISNRYGKPTESGYMAFTADLSKNWLDNTVNFENLLKPFEPNFIVHQPKEMELKAFRQTHILISFPSEKMIELQEYLQPIMNMPFVEIEQGSN